jgi:hypothetical protein
MELSYNMSIAIIDRMSVFQSRFASPQVKNVRQKLRAVADEFRIGDRCAGGSTSSAGAKFKNIPARQSLLR